MEYLGPLQLYFNYRLVMYKHQFWRLVTPFLYFGPINFDFLFHMFFLYVGMTRRMSKSEPAYTLGVGCVTVEC